MPPAAAVPLFMKQAVVELTFGEDPAVDVACHVKKAAVVPEAGATVTFIPLCPDGAVSETGADTFTLELEGVQDWSATGLARLLWDHAGEAVPFRVNAYGTADAAATPGMSGVARAVRPPYGGDAEAYAEIDLELPIIGIPVLGTGAPPPEPPE